MPSKGFSFETASLAAMVLSHTPCYLRGLTGLTALNMYIHLNGNIITHELEVITKPLDDVKAFSPPVKVTAHMRY